MLCLSFDTDHMSEARMTEFLASVQIPGQATFFCTQRYNCLDRSGHEAAPHPFLAPGEDWIAELQRMRALFPHAVGWRSHSCVFSHLLAEWLGRNGYRYASTNDQFGQSGIAPVQQPWGLWHLPIYYMDNMDFSRTRFWSSDVGEPFDPKFIETAIEGEGLYIFDFHPIHLLLNTPNADFYFAARDRFVAGEEVQALAYKGYGTASFYADLCNDMDRRHKASATLADILEATR